VLIDFTNSTSWRNSLTGIFLLITADGNGAQVRELIRVLILGYSIRILRARRSVNIILFFGTLLIVSSID